MGVLCWYCWKHKEKTATANIHSKKSTGSKYLLLCSMGENHLLG